MVLSTLQFINVFALSMTSFIAFDDVRYKWQLTFFNNLKNNFLDLFLAVLGLCRCVGFPQVGAIRGYSFTCGAQASCCCGFSCCRAQALGHGAFSSCSSWTLEHRLSSCGACTWFLHGIRNPPGSVFEPMSLALAGGFFTTGPPRKPST